MKLFTILAMASLSLSALAQSTTNLSSTSTSSSKWEEFKKDYDLGYSGFYSGQALSGLNESVRNTTDGSDATQPLRYDSQLGFDKTIFGDKELAFLIRWRNEIGGKGTNKTENNSTLKDWRVGIQGTWYENGNFSYWARFYLELPMSDNAKNNGRIGATAVSQDFAYRLNDKVLIGAWQVTSYNYFNNETAAPGQLRDNLYTYTAPYINVAISDLATFKAYYEYEFGEANEGVYRRLQNDFLAGVDLQITKDWSFYPHVFVGLDNKINTDDVGLHFWLSGAFF
ncbi:MAG: hypothetical protein JNM93_07250 [Bacteriovoracaceae bacterium]|nr:hypothetical protein [Bacteriovoracaceae bacterium]